MAIEIVMLIVGLILGFFAAIFFAWTLISKQKWGDKASALNEKWKRTIAELQKEYDVKLEKANTSIVLMKEGNKTILERITKEWKIEYIEEIQKLKNLFKDAEKEIKKKSLSSSRRSLMGKFIERFIPFLSKIPYAPADMHFLGQPIDYVIFDGLRDDNVNSITFLEVKTGEGKLTPREKSIKKVIENHKVYWDEIVVDTSTEGEEKTEEDTGSAITELFDYMDGKIKAVSKDLGKTDKVKGKLSYSMICKHCGNEVIVDFNNDEIQELNEGETCEIECADCKKEFKISIEDLENEEADDENELTAICAECMHEYTPSQEGNKCPKCGCKEYAVK